MSKRMEAVASGLQYDVEPSKLGGELKAISNNVDDISLFDNPADLLCPITHEVFRDPVINAVGQVYEREAITNHLRSRSTDPITMTHLPSLQLTPVYPIKSRAMEYRERVAKSCVERACSFRCQDPLKYLRRATELCADVNLRIPGISSEFLSYLQTHTGNAYDVIAIRHFAEGLRRSGYVDQAANVFYRLLQHGEDRSQQAETLKQCLACWMDGEPDEQEGEYAVVAKVAQFVETHQPFSAAQIIDLMREAKISTIFTLKLCNHVLSRMSAESDWQKYRDVLVKYVQLSCQDNLEKLRSVEQRLASVESHPLLMVQSDDISQLHPPQIVKREDAATTAAVFALAAATLFGGAGFGWRVCRLCSLLFLLNRQR